jgi:RNA polymerase sigma-70 factor (ECF subfamily)
VRDEIDRLYERVLVLRCQAGDGTAFAELVESYHARLGGYLARLVGEAAAADALQEVWVAVWRGLPRLVDAAAFEAWAFRIARDQAYRELRRRGPVVTGLPPDGELPADPDEETFSPEDAAALQDALDRLPTEQRDVLGLRYLDGLSYEQIATIVGRPVGTVRSRIHYAKRALRRVLEPEDSP